MRPAAKFLVTLTIISGGSNVAFAQGTGDLLATEDMSVLQAELQTRYDEALALSQDDSIVSANDSRHIWVVEAKAQCAIALGFMKSATRDEPSISKCGFAYDRMRKRVVYEPPIVEPPREVCDTVQPGLVFFDFDSDIPKDGAIETIQFVASNAASCGWDDFRVVGHTDRSGGDAYNDDLSLRRAKAVAALMVGLGVPESTIAVDAEGERSPRVPTDDGVRNPQNRRVAITVSQ